MTIQILVTDQALEIQGDPLDQWQSLDVTRRFNVPASGTVELPAYPEYMEQLQPGNRIVVIRDGSIWCAGPMEEPQNYEWSVDGEQGYGKVTVRFTDDLARVAGYITYPDPAANWDAQVTTSDVWDSEAGLAGAAILNLVDVNCGPSALTNRRVASMVMGSGSAEGTTVTVLTRFEPLLDMCRRVAAVDGLGFRTRQDGAQIVFEVYDPTDLTSTARFSQSLGNVRRLSYSLGAPVATSMMMLGGEKGSRVFKQVASGEQFTWYRVEKASERSGDEGDTTAELTTAGQAELVEHGPDASISVETIDSPDLRAGIDFDLGDLVTVELPAGLEMAEVVQSINLKATPEQGELVTTTIGQSDETRSLQTVRVVRELSRRLGRLEAG
jgi:hypothetical protein